MKLKVVNDYRKPVVLEADTIGSLKARIMDYFSFTEDDLSQRLLVPDGRDMLDMYCPILVNCYDLLVLDDGSILNDLDGLNDGATLLIGWKGPFIVRLEPTPIRSYIAPGSSYKVSVDCYDTISDLKQKLEMATGEPLTVDNLPEILFNADDNKQLLCFGFYRFCKDFRGHDPRFVIYRNRHNKPEADDMNRSLLFCYRTKDGKKPSVRYFEDDGKEELYILAGGGKLIPCEEAFGWRMDLIKKEEHYKAGNTQMTDSMKEDHYKAGDIQDRE